ncbi:DUF4113 domain-containing protein [Serratia marcescens]|uniref:DUF4113 domain-containing protein n=1 Tax=Serratia marcescens TaxID=615 RepID=UPI003FA740D2
MTFFYPTPNPTKLEIPLFSDKVPAGFPSPAADYVSSRINNSGRAQLWFAGQGAHQSWSMKRELLSPAYTTRLSDLPRARVY